MEYDNQAESVYHFALMDMVDMIQIYGLDVVLTDILSEINHRKHILREESSVFEPC